jgi:polyhydroxybutyrate depolymerase
VLLLHGGLTSSKYVAFESRMSEKADEARFIVAYPEGTGGLGRQLLTWNAGDCCGPAQWKARDDVGFIRQLITKLQAEQDIDPERIYVAGVSNGGMMAFRIAGELPDLVAAVATVNGCLQDDEVKLKKPISILALNGSKDKVIRMHGGTGSMFGYKITCPDSRQTIKRFAQEVGCGEVPKKEVLGKGVRETYTGGPHGTEVCLYSLPISHFWSGGRRPFPTFNMLKHEVSATDVIWDFFKAHPKRTQDISKSKDDGGDERIIGL